MIRRFCNVRISLTLRKKSLLNPDIHEVFLSLAQGKIMKIGHRTLVCVNLPSEDVLSVCLEDQH